MWEEEDMHRLIHETRDTFTALMAFSCLTAGILAVVVLIFGPEGWLVERVRAVLQDPNIATLTALAAAIGGLALCKRLGERSIATPLDNLLVGGVGLAGFVVLLQGVRAIVG
jgi:hypothetical protein